ncbi:protein ENHANCED PSEUDOMONAS SUSCEPTIBILTY 1-like [Chenopodium quinoa]|uniref:protein ENHANCED PSEUDOMONAS SUSCEPTIBILTY 1-like n=1 Tax=Chenopodium quinoa TaxID=63459 RepID=UPI000B76E2EA|nr:protein ENHANCED PSEUDOMONAS SUSCEPTIBILTY 1-like [Chenopodium quinoa]
MAGIILISESFIKPKYEVKASKLPYHLSPIEIAMLSIDPIQKGLLFTLNNNTPSKDRTKVVSCLLEKLKHSLSIALVHFYLLAGRLATRKFPDEHACSIYVDCNKGPGARLIHATTHLKDVKVSDIISSTDVNKIVHSFFELGEKIVNHDGHTRALLSIQVTELLDGVFIGFTMNHSVVDGTSFTHFVSMLAEIFRSDGHATKISRVPIFNNKPWINNYVNPNDALKLPYLEPEEFMEHGYEPGPLRERIFHFSSASLIALKAKANQECETHTSISTFQALSALVWRSITRARNLSSNQSISCSILVNGRNRLDPPLSEENFGNIISVAQFVCSVEELMGHDLGWDVGYNFQTIVAHDGKAILDLHKVFSDNPIVYGRQATSDFHGPNRVIIGGSMRFDMFGPEFGLGRAVAARMGYVNKEDGKVTANPGCEGGGSVDLEICFRPNYMATLETDSEFMNYVSLD